MSTPRTRFGLTWWGQRWIGALESFGAVYANRLPRGRTYARHGAVSDLRVEPGRVTARVQGSRAKPYRVELRLPAFDEPTWVAVTAALAGQVRHAAALLDGQMPPDVDEVLAEVGVSLFPSARELATSCSCPDWANPCKHVAAVHYVLAQTFDGDPFLLPTLRGRDRTTLLAGLRAARAGGGPAPQEPEAEDEAVPLSALVASRLWDATGDLDALHVHPSEPHDPAAAVRRLGAPDGVPRRAWPADSLERLVEDGAAVAWRLAAGDDSDDPLLGVLRSLGTASSGELADAVGLSMVEVRNGLARLVADGLVNRTGHARGTRYHA